VKCEADEPLFRGHKCFWATWGGVGESCREGETEEALHAEGIECVGTGAIKPRLGSYRRKNIFNGGPVDPRGMTV